KESAPYLASDVFGPFIQNLPLSDWVDLGRRAGLRFQGSYATPFALRPIVRKGLCGLLAPRSREEVAQFIDILQPAGFHRLLFTRQPAARPPWNLNDELVSWRPALTTLYRSRLPARRLSRNSFVTFRSAATNTLVSVETPPWMAHLLGQAD